MDLLWRLQAGRVGQFVEVGRSIGLPCLAEQFVSLRAGLKKQSPLSCKLGERREPILEGWLLFETPARGAPPGGTNEGRSSKSDRVPHAVG